MYKKLSLLVLIVFWLPANYALGNERAEFVDKLLDQMTLEEKVGQLNQYSDPQVLTGDLDTATSEYRKKYFERGLVGSVLNVVGTENVRKMQDAALKHSRLNIPMLFAYDVIHGYRTTFPIPLAESSSWDLEALELSARIAATEAAASGVNWVFAPMVDVYRDPRWGRVMEGAGEDSYLGSLIAAARVKGFQGDDLSADDTVAACAKHFAAYGAVLAGREYHTVDISKRELWDIHLPPFHAATKAGVRTFMNAFNEYDGIPASSNRYLMRDILRDGWGFDGVIVSDWGSYNGIIAFGVAENKEDAARLALEGGSDVDMESDVYIEGLINLAKQGKLNEKLLDEAVRRVLELKYDLGLFEDPYRYINAEREKRTIRAPAHIAAARDMARKSIVLLKNEKANKGEKLLPLKPKLKHIAVIGPLGDNKVHMNGFWFAQGQAEDVVTLYSGLKKRAPENTKVSFAKGSHLEKGDKKLLKQAIKLAKKADIVVLAVGEDSDKTGEAASRLSIDLYPAQQELVKAIHKTGTPTVMVLMNGRPLSINWSAENIPAIVEAWFLGNEAGNAISDVLYGDYNPSGKLTMTFPRHVGQIPVFYNQQRGNRIYAPNTRFTTKYVDGSNDPLYPFGYGLSYTSFEYSPIKLSKTQISQNETLRVSVSIKNTGSLTGEEIAQLYISDLVGSTIRPILSLKGFKKIKLNPGEEKTVEFEIDNTALSFFDGDKSYRSEPGKFKVLVGPNSVDLNEATFELIK